MGEQNTYFLRTVQALQFDYIDHWYAHGTEYVPENKTHKSGTLRFKRIVQCRPEDRIQ